MKDKEIMKYITSQKIKGEEKDIGLIKLMLSFCRKNFFKKGNIKKKLCKKSIKVSS